jgi:hypothetical protein
MGSIHEKNQGPKISCYCTFKPGNGHIQYHYARSTKHKTFVKGAPDDKWLFTYCMRCLNITVHMLYCNFSSNFYENFFTVFE